MSNAQMMKKMGEYLPLVTILSAVSAGVIAFFAAQAVAEHNEKSGVHTVITQNIRDNAKDIHAQEKVWIVIQAKNEADHKHLAENQTRIMLVLDRMEVKIDSIKLANR